MLTIHSNGSRWAGEAPATIEELIEVLKEHTIEEHFFSKYRTNPYAKGKPAIYGNLCPIDHEQDGFVRFFGNFEKLSHVFRIDTDEPEIIEKLSEAIKANEGWKKYYEKNLVTN